MYLPRKHVIVQHEVAHEGETGKVSRANFHDRLGRTVLIMRPAMQVCSWLSTPTPKRICYIGSKPVVNKSNFFVSFLNYFCSLFQNTNSPEGNVRHLVYLIENGILNLREGQEQMSWLIDFTGFSLNTNVSVKTARECINILQNHYPERLAVAFLYNPPRIFQAFWKV